MLDNISLKTTISEDWDTNMKTETFNYKYGFPGVPVVLRGASRNWQATNLWDKDYIDGICGNKLIDIGRSDEIEKKSLTLTEYLRYMYSTEDRNPYYLKSQFHLYTALNDHYSVPEFFECWYDQSSRKKYRLSWIYMGPSQSYSGLHLDVWDTSAWNAVISGVKLWLFYPTNQGNLLYGGKVNPFAPDLSLFPLFKDAQPFTCIQEKGDIVFTPSGWWHAVFNIERGISITGNFVNESNYKNVLSYFRDKGLEKAYQSMNEIIKNHERAKSYN